MHVCRPFHPITLTLTWTIWSQVVEGLPWTVSADSGINSTSRSPFTEINAPTATVGLDNNCYVRRNMALLKPFRLHSTCIKLLVYLIEWTLKVYTKYTGCALPCRPTLHCIVVYRTAGVNETYTVVYTDYRNHIKVDFV